MADISKIKIGGVTYNIKDATARQGGLVFHLATNAANTPYGVTWIDTSTTPATTITGTLTAWDSTNSKPRTGIYLVKATNTQGNDIYDEYVSVSTADPATQGTTSWERLGNTEIDFSDIASHLQANVSKTTDKVLGESTTFTNASSAVTFTGGTNDTFVKSYPGTKSKLATAEITVVSGEDSFTATNVVQGSDTTASKVTTETKTATNTVLGTATTASKATAGTAVSVAKVAASATNVSYIGNADTNSILGSATVEDETLEIGTVAVSQASVTGTNGTQSITPYTFQDVTVPVITSNNQVDVASVKTNTDVTVPVITSNTSVTKKFATKGGTQVVATGSLDANDTVGEEIMTGLGNATTATAVTGIGTGTAAAQTITVGTNDKVDAMTDASVTITNKNS